MSNIPSERIPLPLTPTIPPIDPASVGISSESVIDLSQNNWVGSERGQDQRPNATTGLNRLVDRFGRLHNNLRVSVTDRCNLRCIYCMPEEVSFQNGEELLSFEEIYSFVKIATGLGITKIRLTGGEPLLRANLDILITKLLSIAGIDSLGLTTNGLLLRGQIKALHQAGLRHLNVSLDTLDQQRFRQLTRRDGLSLILDGLAKAAELGFRVKLNALSIRGFTEKDILPLAKYALIHRFELRFIEYMPIGSETWEREKVLFADQILDLMASEFGAIIPSSDANPHAPAFEYTYADGAGRLGIIASISHPFCSKCNRIRLTADGKLRNCLFALDELDLMPYLRPKLQSEQIISALYQSVQSKWEGHEINSARFVKPQRTMHNIGG